MSQEIFEVTIRGNEECLQALAALDAKVSHSAGATSRQAEDTAKKTLTIGDAFKAVSRDIDAVAGASGSAFGRWASDIYGVAEALGQGGVMAAAAGVTAAVGLGALAWDAWKEHASKAMKDAEEAATRVRDIMEKVAGHAADEENYRKQRNNASVDDLRDSENRLKVSERLIAVERDGLKTALEMARAKNAEAEASVRMWGPMFGNMDRYIASSEAIKSITAQIGNLDKDQLRTGQRIVETSEARLERRKQEAALAKLDAEQARDNARVEARRVGDSNRGNEGIQNRANNVTGQMPGDLDLSFVAGIPMFGIKARLTEMRAASAREEAQAIEEQTALRRMMVVNLDEETAKWKELTGAMDANTEASRTGEQAEQNRIIQSDTATMQQKEKAIQAIADLDIAREADRSKQYQEDLRYQVEIGARTQDWVDALIHEDNKLSAQRIMNRNEETDATIRALERQQQAQRLALAQQAYATGVNATYGASMYYVGQSIDFVSGQAQKFGSINRDNWRDMLAITEDTKAAFAAQLQAFLFNLGIQSGKMAVFEMAEGGKETALMFGDYALAMMGNPLAAASGTTHGISAAAHFATAGAYATLGTGAIGGSLAIGASRGSGGMFSAGSPAGGGGGPGGGGGGPSASSGPGTGGPKGNTWNSPSVININNNYGGGGINATDDRRAAQAVAWGVRNANQSYITRRQMQREP